METTDSDLPVYSVRILAFAAQRIDEAVLHIDETSGKAEADSAAYALAFRPALYAALGTLSTLPSRFPVALDTKGMKAPPARVMPFRYGSVTWRVLYRVLEIDENEPARVEVVTVRHGAQKPLTRQEGRDIDAANR